MLIISLFGSLIGVSVGLFVGSLGKLSEGIKVAVILAISMVCSFLAGLMNSNMKDLVEKHAPIINRINPAALISDAFYCINVYSPLLPQSCHTCSYERCFCYGFIFTDQEESL